MVLLPLTYKSYLSMAKMRVLKPEMEEIKAKVGEDNPTLLQQEYLKLYKKAGVNPGDTGSATRAAEKKIRDAVTAQFNPPASAAKPAAPTAPTADAKPAAEHVVGKIYEDASGNKAEYTGNPDSPWKVVK